MKKLSKILAIMSVLTVFFGSYAFAAGEDNEDEECDIQTAVQGDRTDGGTGDSRVGTGTQSPASSPKGRGKTTSTSASDSDSPPSSPSNKTTR